MEIRNETPFAAAQTILLDKTGAEQLIIALKASYSIVATGELQPAEEQDPISPVDQFHGDPVATSIKQEAEMSPPKVATDAFLIGSAVAPQPKTSAVEVHFRVGDMERTAMVVGNRYWARGVGGVGLTFSHPETFETIPLIWENAYGGTDVTPDDPAHHGCEPRNPVGRGYRAKNSLAEWEGTLLPNIEDPNNYFQAFGQRVDPVGFGPIARNWRPRVTYAGTYDETWLEERMPLLPDDFDDRFHSAGAPGLVLPGYARPGDWVDVVGCSTNGRFYFQLPEFAPAATVLVANNTRDVALNCNTVAVDSERMRLTLLFKGMLRVHREVPRLQRTTIADLGVYA
jgi:hypothetical protein